MWMCLLGQLLAQGRDDDNGERKVNFKVDRAGSVGPNGLLVGGVSVRARPMEVVLGGQDQSTHSG